MSNYIKSKLKWLIWLLMALFFLPFSVFASGSVYLAEDFENELIGTSLQSIDNWHTGFHSSLRQTGEVVENNNNKMIEFYYPSDAVGWASLRTAVSYRFDQTVLNENINYMASGHWVDPEDDFFTFPTGFGFGLWREGHETTGVNSGDASEHWFIRLEGGLIVIRDGKGAIKLISDNEEVNNIYDEMRALGDDGFYFFELVQDGDYHYTYVNGEEIEDLRFVLGSSYATDWHGYHTFPDYFEAGNSPWHLNKVYISDDPFVPDIPPYEPEYTFDEWEYPVSIDFFVNLYKWEMTEENSDLRINFEWEITANQWAIITNKIKEYHKMQFVLVHSATNTIVDISQIKAAGQFDFLSFWSPASFKFSSYFDIDPEDMVLGDEYSFFLIYTNENDERLHNINNSWAYFTYTSETDALEYKDTADEFSELKEKTMAEHATGAARYGIERVIGYMSVYVEQWKSAFPISWVVEVVEIFDEERKKTAADYESGYLDLVISFDHPTEEEEKFEINLLPFEALATSDNFLDTGVSFSGVFNTFRIILTFVVYMSLVMTVIFRTKSFISSMAN